MNLSIFWRLVWKEYRLQRALWLAMMLLTVLLLLIVHATLPISGNYSKETTLYLIALALPGLYAAGCGAILFAGEHEAGTYEFQRTLPVHALSVFVGKIVLALTSVAVMLGLAMELAAFLCNPQAGIPLPQSWCVRAWWTFGFFGLEMFLWTTFFSLLLKRVLVAAVLGLATASISVHFVAEAITWQIAMETYCDAMPGRAAIAALVALVDVALAAGWFIERSSGSSRVVVDAKGITQPAAFSQRCAARIARQFSSGSSGSIGGNRVGRSLPFSARCLCR